MSRPMPVVRSIVVGVIAAALIGGCTPLLMLGELGGPINFGLPLSIITILALVLTAFVSNPKGWRRGFASGIGFSVPIAVTCLFIPRFDPTHLHEHAGQLRFVGAFAILVSVFFMTVRASQRMELPP